MCGISLEWIKCPLCDHDKGRQRDPLRARAVIWANNEDVLLSFWWSILLFFQRAAGKSGVGGQERQDTKIINKYECNSSAGLILRYHWRTSGQYPLFVIIWKCLGLIKTINQLPQAGWQHFQGAVKIWIAKGQNGQTFSELQLKELLPWETAYIKKYIYFAILANFVIK